MVSIIKKQKLISVAVDCFEKGLTFFFIIINFHEKRKKIRSSEFSVQFVYTNNLCELRLSSQKK